MKSKELQTLERKHKVMKDIYDKVTQIPKRKRTEEQNLKIKILGERLYKSNLAIISQMNRDKGINV